MWGPPPGRERTDGMFRVEEPPLEGPLPTRPRVPKVPRYVVVNTKGSLERERLANGNVRTGDLFDWSSSSQNPTPRSSGPTPRKTNRTPRNRRDSRSRLPELASAITRPPMDKDAPPRTALLKKPPMVLELEDYVERNFRRKHHLGSEVEQAWESAGRLPPQKCWAGVPINKEKGEYSFDKVGEIQLLPSLLNHEEIK
mmetsp:Transcript_102440/g.192729  ORF Transcript_102440/g.192729 Transcript_102440/m.192729 type:complete len:198 (-) Transcript_102440:42-635(-)